MPRSFPATARRTVRRALTWRPKLPGQETVSIERLISPFRYDVVVRARFFDTIAESRPDAASMAEFVAEAASHPYAVWFREVELRRFYPWVLRDEAHAATAFARRVERAVRTYDSYLEIGFDTEQPVTLRTLQVPTLSDSGVEVVRPLHLGDGGHRLALLWRSGRELEPAMYRVDTRPTVVIDNTAILAASLPLAEADWARFVSSSFVDEPVTSYAALRDAVQECRPERLSELESLAAAHHLLETCP